MSLSSGTIACAPPFLCTGLDIRSTPYGDDDGTTIDELRPSKRIRLQADGGSTAAAMTATLSGGQPGHAPVVAEAVSMTGSNDDDDATDGMASSGSVPGSAVPVAGQPSAKEPPLSPAGSGRGSEAAGFVGQHPCPTSPVPAAAPATAPVRRADTYPQIREHPAPLAPRSVSMPVEGSGASSSASPALLQAALVPRQLSEGQRGISLLLTFTDDSHKHVERVIRLGECLRKNGFTVTVDMPQQCFQTVGEAEHFLRGRFEGSDYVLTCISPKYKMETESATSAGQGYHSKFVRELIVAGHRASIAASVAGSSRGLPQLLRPQLLCLHLADTDESSMPTWLRSMCPLQYQWPRDFRDVLFCLSKPQRLFEMQAFPDLRHMLPDSADMD